MQINKKDNQEIVEIENVRGGTGKIKFQHYFKKEDFTSKVRLCSCATIPPGASIGNHTHEDEDEVYVILKGSGILSDGKEEYTVEPGDAVLTKSGGSHLIRNNGSEELKFIAFIILY